MKKYFSSLSLLFLFVCGIALTSCSSEKNLILEKRHYGNGYYVHVGNHSNDKAMAASTEKKSSLVSNTTALSVSTENHIDIKTISEKNSVAVKKEIEKNVAKQQSLTKNISEKKDPLPNSKIKTIKAKVFAAKENAPPAYSGIELVLMIILAILVPPLAIFLKEHTSKRFWIDLIVWALGIGFLGLTLGSSFLVFLAALWAVLIILEIV